MKKAVELDPNFALAHAFLGTMYDNVGEAVLAERSLQRTFDLRNRVGEAERFSIEAAYHQVVTQDMPKAEQTCEEWVRSYPGDPYPHFRLASQLGFEGRYEEAAQQLREAIRLAPDLSLPYDNLILFYMTMKRYDEAKVVYQAARANNIENENLEVIRYSLAFVEGDTATMKQIMDASKEKPGFQNEMALQQTQTEAYFGRLRLARELTQAAMAEAEAAGSKDQAATHAVQYALAQAEAGNSPRQRSSPRKRWRRAAEVQWPSLPRWR